MKRTLASFVVLASLSAVCATGILGCGSDSGQDAKKTVEERDRLSAIKAQSGGDWNKLSQSDKDYVLQLVHGSESSAKMLLSPPGGGRPAGGPAAGGRPPGAPNGK